jgi:hypothetical protein
LIPCPLIPGTPRLSRLCRKLREGDDWKYLREFRYLRAGEEFDIDVEDLKREIGKLKRE